MTDFVHFPIFMLYISYSENVSVPLSKLVENSRLQEIVLSKSNANFFLLFFKYKLSLFHFQFTFSLSIQRHILNRLMTYTIHNQHFLIRKRYLSRYSKNEFILLGYLLLFCVSSRGISSYVYETAVVMVSNMYYNQ